MQAPGILHRHQVIADTTRKAERADRRAGVRKQRLLESRIGPGLGDRAGAVVRPDPGLVGLDDQIERGRIHIALLGQHRFQRPHPQLHLGELRAVLMIVVGMMIMIVAVARHGVHLLERMARDLATIPFAPGRLRVRLVAASHDRAIAN